MSRLLPTLALAGLCAACTPPPRPASLAAFEALRVGDQAQQVQDRFPELYQEAETHYRQALQAYERDSDADTAAHQAALAQLVWRTAVARSQQREHEASARAARHQISVSDQQLQAARQRVQVATDAIARQKRLNEMQARLAESERQARRQRRASTAKQQLDAAAAQIKAAEGLDAARHAAEPLAQARQHMVDALDAFEGGNYPEADGTAQLAWRAAQTAVGIAQPKFEAEQAARARAAHLASLVEAGAAIAGAEAHLEARGVVIRMRGLFASGKAALLAPGVPTVDQVARLVAAEPTMRVLVEGHTDNRGRAKRNLALSEARAQAVVQQLTAGGVGADRLTALGRGDEAPIADNSSAAGRAANRRVDVVLLKSAK